MRGITIKRCKPVIAVMLTLVCLGTSTPMTSMAVFASEVTDEEIMGDELNTVIETEQETEEPIESLESVPMEKGTEVIEDTEVVLSTEEEDATEVVEMIDVIEDANVD